ncbi:MAG: hypothetical protein SangKO_076650 [Sandaracinaceae bacterium]|nr:hypothetical protein [Myxococcales bacterium]
MNQNTPPQGGWGQQNQPPPSGFGPTQPVQATSLTPTDSTGEPSQDDRVMAAVAHGATFVEGGLIGPLIIYLLKKDESEFVAFHALQSLYFGLAFLAATVLTCGFGAIILVWPYLIFEVIATIRAYEGQWYELPLVGKYARDKHPGPMPAQF